MPPVSAISLFAHDTYQKMSNPTGYQGDGPKPCCDTSHRSKWFHSRATTRIPYHGRAADSPFGEQRCRGLHPKLCFQGVFALRSILRAEKDAV
jgi:hypothetical protein